MKNSLIMILLLLFSSCGKQKQNKVYIEKNDRDSISPDISKSIENQIRTNHPCPSGERRLSSYRAKIENPIQRNNYSKVRGAITSGHLSTEGKEKKVYTGTNANGDLFFATQLYDGNSNVGYNLTLSLCTDGNLVTKAPTGIDWYANYGMVLSATGDCGKIVSKLLVSFPNRTVSDWRGNSRSVTHREVLEFYGVNECP